MELKLKLPSGPHELFSHDAADNMPGQVFNFKGATDAGRVVKAEVVEYGRAIMLTIEINDE